MRMSLSGVVPRRTQVVGAWYAANATSAPAGSVVRTAGRETRRATVATGVDHRAERLAPDGREERPRHCHHDPTGAEPRPQQWCAPSERGPSPAAGSDREDHQHGDHPSPPDGEDVRRRVRRLAPRLDHRVEGGDEIGDRRKSVIGDFARQRRTICDSVGEISGFTFERSSRLQHQDRVQGRERAVPGERPAAGEHLVEHAPSAKMSARRSTASPRTCSGAMRQRCRRRAIARSGR